MNSQETQRYPAPCGTGYPNNMRARTLTVSNRGTRVGQSYNVLHTNRAHA